MNIYIFYNIERGILSYELVSDVFGVYFYQTNTWKWIFNKENDVLDWQNRP